MTFWRNMALWQKVMLGLIAGIIVGMIIPKEYIGELKILKTLGDMFLRAIKMVIAPLIFFSLVSGITSINDPSNLGRIGIKAVIAFSFTTLFAVLFGLAVALLLKPGEGMNLSFGYVPIPSTFNFSQFLLNIVPDNILGAFVNNDVLQVVFIAVFTGITINNMSSTSSLRKFFATGSKIVMKMIAIVISFSPYGAFALTTWVVSIQGVQILSSLSTLIFAVVLAMALQYIIFGVLIAIFCRVSPIPFYKKSLEYQVLALSTSSSKASLPTTMEVCKKKLGISDATTSFILPLGAAVNMDGFAINLGLMTLFFAQALGITLQLHDYFVIIITITLGTIGGAGIPGASLIMLPMVLSSVNIPIEGVAIITGIDRVLDMLRTVINITGDATITMIIDNSEGNFDKEIYYSNDNN